MLNETEPQCMNCKKPWTREHQNAILKPTFVNGELKKHLEQVMFDRERAQFPATMDVIEYRRISHRLSIEKSIVIEELSLINTKKRILYTKIKENQNMKQLAEIAPKMYPESNAQTLAAESANLEIELNNVNAEYRAKNNRFHFIQDLFQMAPTQRRIAYENHVEGAIAREIVHTIERSEKPKTQFVRACPIESCRGFLSTQWKCGLCGIHTCSKCHVPKTTEEDTEHTCNPDDVATAEFLEKDTKPCPKCGTGIFKIDGCDQMWCTECHSAFNWKTGRLETGHVHNPHYFEYQRRIGANTRNILDLPCNAMQPAQYHGVLTTLLRNATAYIPHKTLNAEVARIKTADTSMSIITFVNMLPGYRQDAILDTLEFRVKYLTEEYNDAEFRSNLFKCAKKFNNEREIGQVLQTVVFALTDILTRLAQYLRDYNRKIDRVVITQAKDDELDVVNQNRQMIQKLYEENPCPIITTLEILSETDKLMEYANECLEKICVEYKIKRVGLFMRSQSDGTAPGLYGISVSKDANGNKVVRKTLRRS